MKAKVRTTRRPATLADIRAGRATKRDQAKVRALLQPLVAAITRSDVSRSEALDLFELLNGANLGDVEPGSEAHRIITCHPPSVGAIAELILLAQDKLEASLAAERTRQTTAAAKERQKDKVKTIADARLRFLSDPTLQAKPVKTAADFLAADCNFAVKARTFEKKIGEWRKDFGITRRRR